MAIVTLIIYSWHWQEGMPAALIIWSEEMESYIVRIYRRDEQDGAPVRGMIETVDARDQEVFGTKEELWEILSALNSPGKKQKKKNHRSIQDKKEN